MSLPKSYIITRNLIEDFLPSWGLTRVNNELNSKLENMDKDEVITLMENFSRVLIDTIDYRINDEKNWIPIMILHPKQSVTFGGQQVKQHINSIISRYPKRLKELIIIAGDSFFKKSNISSVISQFEVPITTYDMNHFAISKSIMSPTYTVLSEEEAEIIKKILVKVPKTMLRTDPANTRLRVRPGTMVEVDRHSMTASIATEYRIVE